MEPDSSSSRLTPFTGKLPLDEFIKKVMASVRGCQKSCVELQGWHHYQDYVGVRRTMERVNSSITTIVNTIFSHQDIKLDLSRHNLLDQMEMIREGNDALLERINSDIDEASGLKKNANAELLDPVIKKIQGPSSLQFGGKNVVLLASRNVQKPQVFFAEKVQNSPKEPFIPIITEKPNSIKPLSILICIDGYGQEYYSHPYDYELQYWTPAASQLSPVVPVTPKPLHETPLIMVTSEPELKDMVEKLKACTEFSVDLEHHSFRSYLGLTCLMQVSTREEDFIVDTLALRGKLTILNEVFTHPEITKVIHGSDYDVLWLQRDCGVYLVNMFDTHQAAVVLEYPSRSLAALLLRFCQIHANKVFQRADWRIRPLTQELVEYARQDSHYLLYIYDLMRNELIERGNQLNNLITAVYQRSTDLCLKRYEKPRIGPESHMNLYRHSRKAFNSRQMFALREVYLWRDRVAREQDESPEYVLPKHMLLQIAEVLPKEMQGILACCNPIPPLVKTELLTLHTVIREAREQPLIDIKSTPTEQQLNTGSGPAAAEVDDLTHSLTCKHDLSQCEDNPSDLPTLLTPRETLLKDVSSESKISPAFKEKSELFGNSKPQHFSQPQNIADVEKGMAERFMSPYERYTTYMEMKPFLEGAKKRKGVEAGDLERVSRVRDHFLLVSNNTVSSSQEAGMVATNHTIQETKIKIEDSSDQPEEESEVLTGGAENVEHITNIVKKNKKNGQSKTIVLQEQIKEKKAKNKAVKRKSNDCNNSPSKVQKTGTEQTEEASTSVVEEKPDQSSEPPAGGSDQPAAQQAFDYDTADYSIFQKAKRGKVPEKKQIIKEKFKGKNQKGRSGKTSMKSFTWGSHKGHR